MSRFENIETQTLIDLLAQNTERLNKLFSQFTQSKQYEENRSTVKAIQAELDRRRELDLDSNDRASSDSQLKC